MSATKTMVSAIKEIIVEELKNQRVEYCKPHEEKIEAMEKQMVQIFCNGLKETIIQTHNTVEKMKSQRWAVPTAIIISILATYFINKLL